MSGILMAATLMGGLGLGLAAILALASRLLAVPEDPRIAAVEQMLPGNNCGACGEPGCRAFAEKVVSGQARPGRCTPSPASGVEAIAEFLGVDAGAEERRVARLHCAGGHRESRAEARYEGQPSCAAAVLVGGGGKACAWGCLGAGDCAVACTFDAITMNENGLPVVNIDKCTACAACVTACPRHLFEVQPLAQALVVHCSAPLAGDAALSVCAVACDACGRCATDAAPGLIEMKNSLPVVDPNGAPLAHPRATRRCPTGAIRWVPDQQFQDEEPAAVPTRRRHALAG